MEAGYDAILTAVPNTASSASLAIAGIEYSMGNWRDSRSARFRPTNPASHYVPTFIVGTSTRRTGDGGGIRWRANNKVPGGVSPDHRATFAAGSINQDGIVLGRRRDPRRC